VELVPFPVIFLMTVFILGRWRPDADELKVKFEPVDAWLMPPRPRKYDIAK
jgi:hypothetical protein